MNYNSKDLLNYLRNQISKDEESCLESGEGLIISDFNRGVMLEMLDYETSDDIEVDRYAVDDLKRTLDEYLSQYLSDKPEAWKWIFLSCAFLSFIKRMPMHPMERTQIEVVEENGRKIYKCPYREEGSKSTCRFCVCVKKA